MNMMLIMKILGITPIPILLIGIIVLKKDGLRDEFVHLLKKCILSVSALLAFYFIVPMLHHSGSAVLSNNTVFYLLTLGLALLVGWLGVIVMIVLISLR